MDACVAPKLTLEVCTALHARRVDRGIIWRAIKKAQVPASKEPVGLSREDAKRPDGAILIPGARGKSMAWDVTVPDMYAQSHLDSTSLQAGAAADKDAIAKKTKYTGITNTPSSYRSRRADHAMPKPPNWSRTYEKELQSSMENLEKRFIYFNASLSLSRKEMRWPTRAHSKLPNLNFSPRGPFQIT